MINLTELISSIDISPGGFFASVEGLAIFTLGVIAYSVFVYNFYSILARRDLFSLNLTRRNKIKHRFLFAITHLVLYIAEYLFLFPLFVFFWFLVISIMIIFLAKSQLVESSMMIAISLVAAVRAASYYKEDLAKDLAKVIPFALLAVFITDISGFSFSSAYAGVIELPTHINSILHYLIFTVLLEFILRLLTHLVTGIRGLSAEELPEGVKEVVDEVKKDIETELHEEKHSIEKKLIGEVKKEREKMKRDLKEEEDSIKKEVEKEKEILKAALKKS